MSFIKQNLYKELLAESKKGNPKAIKIMQSLRKGEKQDYIDTLVKDYYNLSDKDESEKKPVEEEKEETKENINEPKENAVETQETAENEEIDKTEELKEENSEDTTEEDTENNTEDNVEDNGEETTEDKEEIVEENKENSDSENTEEIKTEEEPKETEEEPKEEIDYTEILDKETDGLFDENEIPQLDFAQYLSNKRRDGIRALRGADYFKAFDPLGRERYIEKKKQAYSEKFGDALRDIDRQHNDYIKSLGVYKGLVDGLQDDELELSVENANGAYNDLVGNDKVMRVISRYWDDEDNFSVSSALEELINKYGKKNVLSALDILKGDVDGYKSFRDGQIGEEIERYGKGIEKILK